MSRPVPLTAHHSLARLMPLPWNESPGFSGALISWIYWLPLASPSPDFLTVMDKTRREGVQVFFYFRRFPQGCKTLRPRWRSIQPLSGGKKNAPTWCATFIICPCNPILILYFAHPFVFPEVQMFKCVLDATNQPGLFTLLRGTDEGESRETPAIHFSPTFSCTDIQAKVGHGHKSPSTITGTFWAGPSLAVFCFLIASWQIAVINGRKHSLQPSLDVVPTAPLMD